MAEYELFPPLVEEKIKHAAKEKPGVIPEDMQLFAVKTGITDFT